jgi:hypothetical protein
VSAPWRDEIVGQPVLRELTHVLLRRVGHRVRRRDERRSGQEFRRKRQLLRLGRAVGRELRHLGDGLHVSVHVVGPQRLLPRGRGLAGDDAARLRDGHDRRLIDRSVEAPARVRQVRPEDQCILVHEPLHVVRGVQDAPLSCLHTISFQWSDVDLRSMMVNARAIAGCVAFSCAVGRWSVLWRLHGPSW